MLSVCYHLIDSSLSTKIGVSICCYGSLSPNYYTSKVSIPLE
uniref:Uncharacterized protein n=1 Tax=Anguilla anguilla TaxID=7936 RepID=A0A0E9RVH5_ANGAN